MTTKREGRFSEADASVRLGPTRQLIGGEWVDGVDGRTLAVECPANKRVIASIPRGSAHDVERAVVAAESAFAAWRRVTPSVRGRALLRIADDLEANHETLARIIAHETGNALRTQARPEAALCADVFRYFGGLGGDGLSRAQALVKDWRRDWRHDRLSPPAPARRHL